MLMLIAAMLASQVAGSQGTAAPPASPARSTQQIFDAATRAGEEGRCADAINDFTAIENRPVIAKNAMASAAVSVRKGVCLVRMDRADEAEAAIRAGAATLATKGTDFTVDVRSAHVVLGRLAMLRFDYVAAAQDFRAALANSSGSSRFEPLALLAQVTAFDKSPEPLTLATQALDLIRDDPKVTKDQIATMMALRARIMTIQGQHAQAYAELKSALALQGGLGLKVNISDVLTRSDLAVAAMLLDKPDEARKYLAYTGAGRMKDAPFAKATAMDSPPCGAAGMTRDDFAIVEFSLRDDGSVGGVAPIYATGGREVALEFARAVSTWAWRPEDAQAVPLLFRAATRVEMRCTTAGDAASVMSPIEAAFRQWAGTSTDFWSETGSAARRLPLVLDAVRKAEAGGDTHSLIGLLAWLGMEDIVPAKQRSAHLARASELAVAARAPTPVTTFLRLGQIMADFPTDGRRAQAARRALLATPAVAANPLSVATLRLILAMPGYRMAAPPDAAALLDALLADPQMPPTHPLRVNALLQRATLAAASGQIDAAQNYFAQTGLTEQQCALIGVQPALKSTGISGAQFPREAQVMGFEGWVKLEFDINANGSTATPRPVIAYPPMIFNKAAKEISKGVRYRSSYRPEGGAACTGKQENIVFRLP
ncbi:hypothetical protein WG908_09505 [Sphingobium sp. AN641]|uniref:hypothetical protein n=1 Tax=Sphingobium sp. AN641 TaxID=3133443 RepID=UPI0030BC74BD